MNKQEIINIDFTKITESFKWKDKFNNFYFIDSMQTHHLWFTLRMIWNHTMPENAKIYPYQRYDFSSFYTEEYFKQAIRFITIELSKRTDMKNKWKNELQRMIDYLKINQVERSYEQTGVIKF